eukprot:scaffold747_cov120-Cylindrotheca_fusiformis.AAC.10
MSCLQLQHVPQLRVCSVTTSVGHASAIISFRPIISRTEFQPIASATISSRHARDRANDSPETGTWQGLRSDFVSLRSCYTGYCQSS